MTSLTPSIPSPPRATKRCPRCRGRFSRAEFYEGAKRKRAYCRGCVAAISAEKRARNPQAARDAAKRWSDRNRERERVRQRTWARANPQSRAAATARYRECYPDAYARWQRENRDKVAEYSRQRRARRTAAHVERVEVLVLLERQDGACGICGEDVELDDFHVDHIVPLVKGGLHNYENCQIAHPVCNLRKGAV